MDFQRPCRVRKTSFKEGYMVLNIETKEWEPEGGHVEVEVSQ